MDKTALKEALEMMGHYKIHDGQLERLVQRYDKDNTGFIEWFEFLDIVYTIKIRGRQSALAEVKVEPENMQETSSNYLNEEVSVLARCINKELANVEELKERLPINPYNEDLFE